jgi:hypothetical protein
MTVSVKCRTAVKGLFHYFRGRRGRDCMVVGFTTIATKYVSLNPTHGEVYLTQFYMIRFVSDLRQVVDFLLVLRFPPLIELTATI